ncbi:Na+/H+ antiporter NhaA, partial [Francisella orientalis]
GESFSSSQIYGISLLCGIGFTMSLFIGTLAFDDNYTLNAIKVGVIVGSLLSGICGYIVLRFIARNPH